MSQMQFNRAFEGVISDVMRDLAMAPPEGGGGGEEGKGGRPASRRADGRALDQLRPVSCSGRPLMPRGKVHGAALFSRGETQVLSLATVGEGQKPISGGICNWIKMVQEGQRKDEGFRSSLYPSPMP